MTIQVFKPYICPEAIEAVSKVLQSGWTGNSVVSIKFEQDFQNYIGGGLAVAVSSATAGLQIALELFNISKDDEVITVSNTFVSTNHAILYQQATPVFCDIEKETGCIDVNKIEELITSKTKVIICVHYSGLPCKIDQLREICQKYSLKLLHDCAHACGSSYKNKKIGNVEGTNEIAVFSMQSVKNLSIGDYGVVMVPTLEMNERARKLRWLNINKDTASRSNVSKSGSYSYLYEVEGIGWKANPTDIMSAIGVEQLKILDKGNARRKQICEFYKKELNGFNRIRFADLDEGCESSYHFLPMWCDKRDDLITHLQSNDIFPGMHYVGNHRYIAYENYRVNLPNADWHTEHELTLPCHLLLSDIDCEKVVEVIKMGW